MGEFWFNNVGQNLLSGLPDSTANMTGSIPPGCPGGPALNPNQAMLCDGQIQDLLLRIPAARSSFNRLVPTMTPAEQERLMRIAAQVANLMMEDPWDVTDQFQHVLNTTSIRTAGPRGGGNWSGRPLVAPPELQK